MNSGVTNVEKNPALPNKSPNPGRRDFLGLANPEPQKSSILWSECQKR